MAALPDRRPAAARALALMSGWATASDFALATFLPALLLLLGFCAPGRLPSSGWSLRADPPVVPLSFGFSTWARWASGRGWPTRRCGFAAVPRRRERWLSRAGRRRDCRRPIRLGRFANLSTVPGVDSYGVAAGGAGFMIAALVPLLLMPSAEVTTPNTKPRPVVAPRRDHRSRHAERSGLLGALPRRPLLRLLCWLLVLVLQRRDPIGAELLIPCRYWACRCFFADRANRHEVWAVKRQPVAQALADRGQPAGDDRKPVGGGGRAVSLPPPRPNTGRGSSRGHCGLPTRG